MKNFRTIQALLMAGILISSSCKKALEEKVYDFVSPNNFFKTEADAIAASNGIYNMLLSFGFYKQNLWTVDMDADHSSGPTWFMGSMGAGNPQDYWGTPNIWNDHYVMIARANAVLENVTPMTISEAVKNRTLGEAYFFRAFSYFDLVRLYGGVPIKLATVSSGAELFTPRASVMNTYQQIIADLKQAETLLYPSGDQRTGEPGRVSREVASAYLAKVYLTIGSGSLTGANITVNTGKPTEWAAYTFAKNVVAGLEGVNSQLYYDSARIKCEEVIGTNKFGLFPAFMDVWKIANRNKGENMLMANARAGGLSLDDLWGYFNAARPDGSNTGWVWTTKNVYKNYEKMDHRALHGITHQWKVFGSNFYFPEEDVEYKTDGTNTYIWNKDYDRAFVTKYADVSTKTFQDNDMPFPILRSADVYLMHAEAVNELNPAPTSAAYTSLNTVRLRSHASEAPVNMNKEQFRSFVLEERGRELLLENNRRFDLVRWGIYLQVMNKMTVDQFDIVKARNARNLLLPIPLTEINTNKGLEGKNNPGW
jgi:starch-binding outer membrane protein, SusD/RagB family